MKQSWCSLAFLHWRVPVDAVRQKLPPGLDVDTFDGSAWLGVVPFRMEGVRIRNVPPVPTTTSFPELNVRTYVTADGKPGVWFFSLDAASRVTALVARTWYGLPYHGAAMEMSEEDGSVSYASVRDGGGAVFRGRYGPAGSEFRAEAGSLEHFLAERYCLYAPAKGGGLARCDILHAPWELRPARAVILENTMAEAAGFGVPREPHHALFARRVDAWAWAPEPVASAVLVRPERPGDEIPIASVHQKSFPTPVEARLVDLLRKRGKLRVSLVAERHGKVVGHAAFSPVTLEGLADGLGLGPVAVLETERRKGVAAALIREGLAECRKLGAPFVVVLGDPKYYARFGFEHRPDLRSEYDAGEAFRSLTFRPIALRGLIRYAPEFREAGA